MQAAEGRGLAFIGGFLTGFSVRLQSMKAFPTLRFPADTALLYNKPPQMANTAGLNIHSRSRR